MNKVVLITGSSSGIGRETAKLFQTKDWKAAATMRDPQKAGDLRNIVDLECIRLDVTDPGSIKNAFADTLERFERIDVVVNNAGYAAVGPFEASTPEQVERQFRTNVFGVMNVCREIIPYFRQEKRGYIVNIASIGGRTAFPLYSLYNSTKWAVEGFSESLQYELEQFNVRVKLIEPGPIKTDFYGRSEEVMKKDGLTAYDYFAARVMPKMQEYGEQAPDPAAVAQVIYDAVTDGSKRLRYGVNTKGLLTMRRVLPEGIFRGLTKKIFLK